MHTLYDLYCRSACLACKKFCWLSICMGMLRIGRWQWFLSVEDDALKDCYACNCEHWFASWQYAVRWCGYLPADTSRCCYFEQHTIHFGSVCATKASLIGHQEIHTVHWLPCRLLLRNPNYFQVNLPNSWQTNVHTYCMLWNVFMIENLCTSASIPAVRWYSTVTANFTDLIAVCSTS